MSIIGIELRNTLTLLNMGAGLAMAFVDDDTTHYGGQTLLVTRKQRSQVDPFMHAENGANDEVFTFPPTLWCANQGLCPDTEVSAHLSLSECAKAIASE